MNKNLIYAGYVAVGAFIVYLLLKKDKKQTTDKDINPVPKTSNQNNLTVKPNTQIEVSSIGLIKEKNLADYEKEFSAMSDEEIKKLIPEHKRRACFLITAKLAKPDYKHNAFLKEVSKRGLNSIFDNQPCR